MRYDPRKIEAKWQKKWLAEKVYEPDLKRTKKPSHAKALAGKPFYNLMMFPYPSAEGLHIGGVRTFTGVDIYGRFKRMQGYDVFEPIGLDGFGIHSENYAIKIGKHPMDLAKITEKNFYRQMLAMGNGFAWDERLETYDPEYHKWTQWIFVQLFKHGLAYRKKQAVNWCPSCQTVLADEQVIPVRSSLGEVGAGACERCGTIVEKRELEQWFFRITKYADRLNKNLDKIKWDERVKIAQRNWIGRSEGASITFKLTGVPGQEDSKHSVEVFTTRPDTLFGATYLAISPELAKKWLDVGRPASDEVKKYVDEAIIKTEADRIAEGREKTGVNTGLFAINPANQEKIPVWIADYVLGNVGTGAIMAVPAHDDRDLAFQKKYGLGIRRVIGDVTMPQVDSGKLKAYELASLKLMSESGSAWTYDGILMNSDRFDGMDSEKAKWEITKFVGGKKVTKYRLRDWLISRQRYWGPPIPLIFCQNCAGAGRGYHKEMPGWYPVPEKDLPVKLPYIKDFRPSGSGHSPLANVPKFYKVRCPKCKSWAKRETDVSDTFLDSAWYYLRYPSVNEKNKPWNPQITQKWFPVDMYIGGTEHSVLHLLYVRFLAMVFKDLKLVHFEEPFKEFRAHGLITKDGAKMSKSKGNVVNPDDYMRAYGTDAVRMYLAFLAPLTEGGDFRDAGIKGITRFLERSWKFVLNHHSNVRNKGNIQPAKDNPVERLLHKTIKKVGEDIETLQYNTAISALMVLLNEFEDRPELVTHENIIFFLKLLAPFAPYITEELYHEIAKEESQSIHKERWPKFNPKMLREETFELIVQVNGKLRGRVALPQGATEAEAKKVALSLENVKEFIPSEPKKIIYVPNRLINFVV